MQALRRQRPEIPHCRRRAHVGLRVPLLRVNEVRELVGIAHEKHRRVVADEIPIAFLGVEFQRKAAHVAFGISSAELAGDGGEARQHWRPGARLQRLGLGEFRDVAADGERAVRAPALGVHGTLGDAFPLLMGKLLDELVVLQQDRSAWPRGDGALIVGDRRASRRR
jgi:hypothetical protein